MLPGGKGRGRVRVQVHCIRRACHPPPSTRGWLVLLLNAKGLKKFKARWFIKFEIKLGFGVKTGRGNWSRQHLTPAPGSRPAPGTASARRCPAAAPRGSPPARRGAHPARPARRRWRRRPVARVPAARGLYRIGKQLNRRHLRTIRSQSRIKNEIKRMSEREPWTSFLSLRTDAARG